MSTLLRTPAHNPGLTTLHNSKAVAAFSPIVFEWTRRDYDVVSVAENGGRSNQLDIVISGDITAEVTGGGTLWLESSGNYSGEATVIGSSYSAPNTTITTTALRNASAVTEYDFINLISDRPNWRQLCNFVGVDGNTGASTGSITTAAIKPGPGPLFRMSIDAGPFIRSEFDLLDLPEWDTSTRQQLLDGRGFLFYIGYSELYDGATPSEVLTDTFLALPASKGARDIRGESAIDLEVWENSLSDEYKPVLSNALPNPVFFRGYPFFASFGKVDTDLPTWQLIQNNNFDTNTTPSTTQTNAFIPDGGFHLVTAQDVAGDLRQVNMWLEAGVFWSFWTVFDVAVDGGGLHTFSPIINLTSGTFPNWLFEDGRETVSAPAPNGADYVGLDGTLQEVKVTGITADQIQTFEANSFDYKIIGELSFQPCSALSSIKILLHDSITSVIGPTTTTQNLTYFEIQECDGVTNINLSNTAILSGYFELNGLPSLTNVSFPTVPLYAFDDFYIMGCTSLTQKIPLGIKFPNLMGKNGSTVLMGGNGWDAATTDYYLSQLDECCPYGFTGRIILITGNTAPTAASLGARLSLAAKGVNVITD